MFSEVAGSSAPPPGSVVEAALTRHCKTWGNLLATRLSSRLSAQLQNEDGSVSETTGRWTALHASTLDIAEPASWVTIVCLVEMVEDSASGPSSVIARILVERSLHAQAAPTASCATELVQEAVLFTAPLPLAELRRAQVSTQWAQALESAGTTLLNKVDEAVATSWLSE